MLMTVTNLTSRTLNDLDPYYNVPGGTVAAYGGGRKDPLPYPFDWVVLAPAASKQLPVRAKDWRHCSGNKSFDPFDAGALWQQIVQEGKVSVTFAAETGSTDVEESFLHLV